METAKQVYLKNKLYQASIRAFVVDDTLKHRRGKKVEGVSSHFDHTTCHYTMGQQILELGYANNQGFLSLDSQIFIGQTKTQPLQKEFLNQRSAVAKNYKCAVEKDKNDMLIEMISRADRFGFKADYLLTDAWFGVKKTLGLHYQKN